MYCQQLFSHCLSTVGVVVTLRLALVARLMKMYWLIQQLGLFSCHVAIDIMILKQAGGAGGLVLTAHSVGRVNKIGL